MAQHAIFSLDCKLILESFIIAHLMTCNPLPCFTCSENCSERSLVLKSVTERNLMSCGLDWRS